MTREEKKQAFNPYLPSYEYVPDGEPHVFGDRLYIYGSHDKFKGRKFCENDYVCYSAPIDDLADWRYEGVIYKKTQDPDNAKGKKAMYAPDVAQGPDGRCYLYYGLADDTKIGVAVCDTPAGQYQFYGMVQDANGGIWGRRPGDFMPFDPGILVEGPGIIHLYAGQGLFMPGRARKEYDRGFRNTAFHVSLADDMKTMISEPIEIVPNIWNSKGTGFEGHEFFEANSIRKYDDWYYFIYSSVHNHDLCYAMSKRADGDFQYGGRLHSNGDIFSNTRVGFQAKPSREVKNYISNNHGSLVQINDKYYVFGHRHTNQSMFSRQGIAEQIERNEDGTFRQAPLTSCGLNNGPLRGIGVYPSYIACHLFSKNGAMYNIPIQSRIHPYLTQSGGDREDNPDQHVANLRDGAVAGFRYFDFEKDHPTHLSVTLRGKASGVMKVRDQENGTVLAAIPVDVKNKKDWENVCGAFTSPGKVSGLYFTFEGKGYVDFLQFELIAKDGDKSGTTFNSQITGGCACISSQASPLLF